MRNELAAPDGSVATSAHSYGTAAPCCASSAEVGNLPSDNRYTDPLFEVVNRRYEAAGPSS